MVLKQLFGKKGDSSKESKSLPTTGIQAEQPKEAAAASQATPQVQNNLSFLEKAMIDNIRNDNQESRFRVYQELLFSELEVAVEENSHGAKLLVLPATESVHFAVAFTSETPKRRWRPEGGEFGRKRGQDIYKLLESTSADFFVINPGSAPMIELSKVEFRQLAQGIVPQSKQSPVRIPVEQQAQVQISFPKDVFADNQREHIQAILSTDQKVEAAACIGILPPGADPSKGWIRTVALRPIGIEQTESVLQEFCNIMHKNISENTELFTDVSFQCVPMIDPNFWAAASQNSVVLFDRNPPPVNVEVGFSPDIFNPEQKARTVQILSNNHHIEGATIGSVTPPGADPKTGTIRTVFIKVKDVAEGTDLQAFCRSIRDEIVADQNLFNETTFEVGIMDDPNFWAAMKQNQWALFDHNPPQTPSGVVDANV